MKSELINGGKGGISFFSEDANKEYIIVMNPKTPSRVEHMENNGLSPMPYSQDLINILQLLGAPSFLAPCNTSHYFFVCLFKNTYGRYD